MIRILIPLDGSNAAEEALNHALLIARTFPAELTLLRVIAESEGGSASRIDSVDLALYRYQAQAYLDGLHVKYADRQVSIRCEVAEGKPAETIVRVMTRTKPDLLVLTRYGRGNAQDFVAGGTAHKIISSTRCSTLLLDPGKHIDPDRGYRRILIPIDEDKDSECALAIATMIAEIHEASLVLLHIVDEPRLPRGFPVTVHARQLINDMQQIIRQDAERRLRDLAARIPNHVPIETRVLLSPEISLGIESTAEDCDCDLIVLHNTDSRHEDGCRYSSVNPSLIQYSHRPLFILQSCASEGFSSNFRSVYIDEQQREAG